MNAPVKSFAAVKIAVLPPVARLNLRITPSNLAAASAAYGLPLPTKIGQGVAMNGHAAWCLGPDEWLLHAPEAEQAALDAFQISPTAPMFGVRCQLATGQPGAIENEVLAAAGFARDDFKSIRYLTLDGMRRSLRVRVHELEIEFPSEQRAVLRFALPSGAFATALLSEVMKTPNVA